MSWPLIKYVLTASVRDRLVLAVFLILVLGASLSVFMGSAAVMEKDRFTLVFAGAGLRLTGVMGLVLFVVFYIRRSFEAKDVEFLLSRPVSRPQLLFSYAVAFSLLALIVGAGESLAIYILGPHLFSSGHLIWSISIMVENIIMVNTALFFSMVIGSAAGAAMTCFAFYVLARMMGQILGIVYSSKTGSSLLDPMEFTVQVVSVITPRLDLMGQTSWLIYGFDGQTGLLVLCLQGIFFVMLVLLAALLDLKFRQF